MQHNAGQSIRCHRPFSLPSLLRCYANFAAGTCSGGLEKNQTCRRRAGWGLRSAEHASMASSRVRGFLFDMDGGLYRRRRARPGARALLDALDRDGIPFALVTNNSTRTPRQYARVLAAMGMRVPEARIVTSSVGVASYLRATLRRGSPGPADARRPRAPRRQSGRP